MRLQVFTTCVGAAASTVDTLMLLLYTGTRVRNATTDSFYPALPPRFPETVMRSSGLRKAPDKGTQVKPLGGPYVLVSDSAP